MTTSTIPTPRAAPRVAPAGAPARSLLDELLCTAGRQSETFDPPLTSPGIPGDNALYPHAGAARQAAQAAADRLNAGSSKSGGRYTYGVAHHAPKQPGDRGHYHVVDEGGNQRSGHFFYGPQPAKRQERDYPTMPGRDRKAPDRGPFPPPKRREKQADPAGYAQRKNQAAQRNYDHARAEWYEARVGKVEGRRGRNMRKGRERELAWETGAPASVIHPNIDVHAQYALQRMQRSPDPAARADGAGLLAAVRGGQLRGIYKEDQQVPALRARRLGRSWWQVIPAGEDAVLFLDAQEAPLIDFRDRVRSDAARLDPALRKAWRVFVRWRNGLPQRCGQGLGPAIVPAGYCPVADNPPDPLTTAIDFFCAKLADKPELLDPGHNKTCFDAVAGVMKYLTDKAPANNRVPVPLSLKGANLCASLTREPGANCTFNGVWPPGRYAVVQYRPGLLSQAVATLKCALDRGNVVRAGVLSGRCDDVPSSSCDVPKILSWRDCPEHYLLIVGYEGNTFVFWDHSGVTNDDIVASSWQACGAVGFGLLHYDPGNDRLTTAMNGGDLLIKDIGGAHVQPRNGRLQKRYQVLSLQSGSYREPLRKCAGDSQSAELSLLDELLRFS